MSGYLRFDSNSFSGTIPTGETELRHITRSPPLAAAAALTRFTPTFPELGRLASMTSYFQIFSNNVCSDVPTQVQALSSGVTSGWAVTTGTSIGTVCGWIEDSRFPGAGSTTATSIDYNGAGLTGTIPSQV